MTTCWRLFPVLAAILAISATARADPPGNVRAAHSGPAFSSAPVVPLTPGLIVDRHNVDTYEHYLPYAAIVMVKHGFRIRLAQSHRLDWSSGYERATEKYSPQVTLDADDDLQNYVAGAPFPLIKVEDPKAARKIAYDWHMGPFMPDDFSLTPWGSFGYADTTRAESPIVSAPDYHFVGDRFTFLRFAHRTEVAPMPTLGENSQGYEWKARCGRWNIEGDEGGETIWTRFLDPHRGDEDFIFDRRTRNVREVHAIPYLTHQCRSCHQPYWAYALPKTEVFSYRLLGTTPILGCMMADREPAGFIGRSEEAESDSLRQTASLLTGGERTTLDEEPFELRSAYILEMIPVDPAYGNFIALVWIDTETYVWLAAEFFESNKSNETSELQEVAMPLWRTHPAPEGGNLFDLAGSFYVPLAYQPALPAHAQNASIGEGKKMLFFRSVVPPHGPYDQKINAGFHDEAIFNSRALGQ